MVRPVLEVELFVVSVCTMRDFVEGFSSKENCWKLTYVPLPSPWKNPNKLLKS